METAEDRALAYARQLMVARYVADHWRQVIMDKFPDDAKWAAHPLCMVLDALRGETEPIKLGLDPEVWDDFKVRVIDGDRYE